MRKYLILFVFTSLFWSCGNVNKAFKNYWRKIPVIKLPLTITCGLCNSDTSINRSIVEKYSFTGAEVIGRLDDKNNVFIIYSYPGDVCYPYLYVYNQQGKMIDSVSLYISTCKKDKYLSYTSWSIIYLDKSITVTDTEKHFTIDTIRHQRFLEKIRIQQRNYKPDKEGIPVGTSFNSSVNVVHKLSP